MCVLRLVLEQDGDPWAQILQVARHLAALVRRVERRGGRARRGDREEERDDLGPVRQREGDDVAGRHAGGDELTRESLDDDSEVVVRELVVAARLQQRDAAAAAAPERIECRAIARVRPMVGR